MIKNRTIKIKSIEKENLLIAITGIKIIISTVRMTIIIIIMITIMIRMNICNHIKT